MTIPKNSKLWLKDFPGKLWIIEEIKDLMKKCGLSYSYSLKVNEDIHCLYIYEQTYTFGTSPTCNIGSPFYKADGKLIQLGDLFPTPVLTPNTKYKVQLYGYHDGFELAQKWGFDHGYKWHKGVPRLENTNIVVTKSYGIFFLEGGKLTYCSGETTYAGETGTQLYLSQLLNIKHNGEQVKVQGSDQPEPGCTGCSPVRFQSRGCKIATGERRTGYPAKYYHSGTRIVTSQIRGTVPESGYPGRFLKAEGFPGGLRTTTQAERGAVLGSPYTVFKRKYATSNSKIDF